MADCNSVYHIESNSVKNPNCGFETSVKDQDDQIQETIVESPVIGRIPSPSSVSSVTSGRRLEWDSGADVGYNLIEDQVHGGSSLSTIERIALARGCSAALFERLDPEGISAPPKPFIGAQLSCNLLDSPVAKSTPIFKSENINNARKEEWNPLTLEVETVMPENYIYLHSSEEFENEVAPPGNECPARATGSADDDKIRHVENIHKKYSNSLTNLSSSHEEIKSTMPRSQSHLNLLDADNNDKQNKERSLSNVQLSGMLVAACSVSSSSVATIVQKQIFPKTSNKLIQTLPVKLSVGVQADENSEFSVMKKEVLVSCDNQFHSLKCGGAHKKGSVLLNDSCNNSEQKSNANKSNGNCAYMLKEVKGNFLAESKNKTSGEAVSVDSDSTSQTVELACAPDTSNSGTGVLTEVLHGSASAADSANSFEYLPGHVFEKGYRSQSDSSKQSGMSEACDNTLLSKDKEPRLANQRLDTCSSSLYKDIEEGVQMLQKLMSEKTYNSQTKKILIRKIVNKLVSTEYAEDSLDSGQLQDISLSSNVPWVPSAAGTQCLKKGKSYKYIGAGDWNKSTENSSGQSSSNSGKNKLVENGSTSSSSKYTLSGSVSMLSDNDKSQTESSRAPSVKVSERVQRDWKRPTSKTEKDFEKNRANSDTSESTTSLLHICKSEHEKQLQWIRFEIDHLSHLKLLLEKQEKVTKTLSNIVDHDHKFHKICPVYKKFHRSMLERSMEKRSKNWINSTECSSVKDGDTSQGNATVQKESSLKYCPQDKVMSGRLPHSYTENQVTPLRRTLSKHDLSTQTSTFDSYVLNNDDSQDSINGLGVSSFASNNKARLNVYAQTSPKAKKKHEKKFPNTTSYTNATENARKSYESAVKCCCECQKALREIMNPDKTIKKNEQAQGYCTCKFASSGDSSKISSSFDQSGSITSFQDQQYSDSGRNSSEFGHKGQKHNIATETNINKSVQTSNSLHSISIIKSKGNQEKITESANIRTGERVCPCCGLLEKPFNSEKTQCWEKSKRETKDQQKYSSFQREKANAICNASVQTSNTEPCAYLLTFEPASKESVRTQCNESLPEIKLLVPVGRNSLEDEVKRKSQGINSFKENLQPPQRVEITNPRDKFVQIGEEKKKQKLTLQEYLRANRPDYIQNADKRSQCLADLALLRDLRKQKRLELMAMTDKPEIAENKESSEDRVVPCTSISSKPKFSTRTMREQSRRKYHRTREVQSKLVEKKKKEDFRTNRLMAELFTKKLQKKVLKGVVNHSNGSSVISSSL